MFLKIQFYHNFCRHIGSRNLLFRMKVIFIIQLYTKYKLKTNQIVKTGIKASKISFYHDFYNNNGCRTLIPDKVPNIVLSTQVHTKQNLCTFLIFKGLNR